MNKSWDECPGYCKSVDCTPGVIEADGAVYKSELWYVVPVELGETVLVGLALGCLFINRDIQVYDSPSPRWPLSTP